MSSVPKKADKLNLSLSLNAEILLIGPLEINFSEIIIKINVF